MTEAAIVVRRRRWKPEEKAALLAEIEAAGGRVSVVARRHGISQSLLYNWRAALKAAASMRGVEPLEFMPVGMLGCAREAGSALLPTAAQDHAPLSQHDHRQTRVGLIEIALPSGVRVCVDSAVKATALREVFQALKETA